MIKIGLVLVGWLVLVLAETSAFAESITFGPKVYARSTDAPVVTIDEFKACAAGPGYRLIVENGDPDGSRRISSATILLNGVQVLGPDDLNQNVAQVERTVAVQATNTLEVRLASGPGRKLSVKLVCITGCFSVAILSPAEGAVIDRHQIIVTGSITGSGGEVGVSVNELPAAIAGSRFAVGQIIVAPGENRLTAVSANACGQTAEHSVTVFVDPAEQNTMLDVSRVTGPAPLDVTLNAVALLDAPATLYEWDFDGNGTVDASGPELAEVSTTYAEAGMYLPSVVISDADGNRYTEAGVISVYSAAAVRSLLEQKWETLRTAMQNQDVDAAAGVFSQQTREKYRRTFTIMRDILPQLAAELGTPRFVRFVEFGAFYDLTAVRGGQEKSFHVEFVLDVDGIWRIRWF